MRYQDSVRLVIALAFFAGGVANAIMVLRAPEIYEGFADLSFLSFYQTLWQRVVLPNLGLLMGLVVAFEFGLGVLLLAPDPYAHAGLILAAAFAVLLVPFWWGGGALINVLLFILLVWLLRFEYPASMLSLVFGR